MPILKPVILLVLEDVFLARSLEQLLCESGFQIVRLSPDDPSLLSSAAESQPHVLLMEIAGNPEQRLTLLGQLKSCLEPSVIFAAITALEMPWMAARLHQLGIEHLLLRPLDHRFMIRWLTRLVHSLALPAGAAETAPSGEALQLRAGRHLQYLGISARLKGYAYLRCAIELGVTQPELLSSVTKRLYPAIAHRFSATPTQVERSIRHAIELAWRRTNPHVLSEYFEGALLHPGKRPSNLEFIKVMVETLEQTPW